MKKSIQSFLWKSMLLAWALALWAFSDVNAQEIEIVKVGTPLPQGDCMSPTGNYQFTLNDLTNKSNFSWYAFGDLEIVSGDNTGTVTVRSVSKNLKVNPIYGYGKARIRVSYIDGNISADCGPQYREFDLYKLFDKPTEKVEIVGPECLTRGDT